MGLTAADAAQRGFDVVIVEDAIARCDERHGATLIEWLRSMYELEIMRADALPAAS